MHRFAITMGVKCCQQANALIESTIVQRIGKRRAVAIEDPDRQQYEKNHVGTAQTTKQGLGVLRQAPCFVYLNSEALTMT